MSERLAKNVLTSAGVRLLRDSLPTNRFKDRFKTEDPSEEPRREKDKNRSFSRACSACHAEFQNREQQVQHYKLDWHRLNIKRKILGLTAVAEEDFEKISGDVSSISGSGSEGSSDTESESFGQQQSSSSLVSSVHQRSSRQHFITRDNQLFSVYRCVLNQMEDGTFMIPESSAWIIVMLSGGHFAAAVFEKDEVISHKTFHRYTVRAKRGTAQSTRDSQQGGKQPKSAGASLRRHNEAALIDDIRELFQQWSSYIERADKIFLKTPGRNRNVFLSGPHPLLTKERRVSSIPFTTRRPTFKEVRRVHGMLSFIRFHENEETTKVEVKDLSEEKISPMEPMSVQRDECPSSGDLEMQEDQRDISVISVSKTNEVLSEEEGEEEEDPHSAAPVSRSTSTIDSEFAAACRSGSVDAVKIILDRLERENGEDFSMTEKLSNRKFGKQRETCLHIASQCGHTSLVAFLLTIGSDPAQRDKLGRPPYAVARDKPARNAFRRFMADYPDKYDYAAAQVPSPLTEDIEKEKDRKKQERRKMQQKARKEKKKEEKELLRKKEEEEEEKRKWDSLSDREKRALAAEKRLAKSKVANASDVAMQSGEVCSSCRRSLAGITPFSRLQYKYCSMGCLKDHKQTLS